MRERRYSSLVNFKTTPAAAKAIFARAELKGVSASEIIRRAVERELSDSRNEDDRPSQEQPAKMAA